MCVQFSDCLLQLLADNCHIVLSSCQHTLRTLVYLPHPVYVLLLLHYNLLLLHYNHFTAVWTMYRLSLISAKVLSACSALLLLITTVAVQE